MRTLHWSLIAMACTLAIAGCKKKPAEPDAATTTPPAATAPAPAAEPAEMTAEQRDAEAKRAKLAYATMEDGYINDPKAQWAASAKASSSFNETPEPSAGSCASSPRPRPRSGASS